MGVTWQPIATMVSVPYHYDSFASDEAATQLSQSGVGKPLVLGLKQEVQSEWQAYSDV